MTDENRIPVSLEEALVKTMLAGLLNGAKGKLLKVIIGSDNSIHVKSKETRMILHESSSGGKLEYIKIHNESLEALLTRDMLQGMGLASAADSAVRAIREQYNPCLHSLSDNLYVFARQYGHD